jgi:hypothetical protein
MKGKHDSDMIEMYKVHLVEDGILIEVFDFMNSVTNSYFINTDPPKMPKTGNNGKAFRNYSV